LIDLDGVLVHSSHPVQGAAEAFNRLRERRKTLIFSNNSTRSREDFADQLGEMGLSVKAEEIVNSAHIVSRYIEEEWGLSDVFTIGEGGLNKELEFIGHRLVPASEAEFVVAGMDRKLTYEKLNEALTALTRGAKFIATNLDGTYPTPEGAAPGAGAIVGAIEGMGYPPLKTVGKPSPISVRIALEEAETKAENCLLVGDRLETDILAAERAGIDSVLVLTGVSAREEIEERGIRPTYVVDELEDLLRE